MNIKYLAITGICLLYSMQISFGHCQIPCGIYDDLMRIHQMEEHVLTIEKSINKLADNPNDNQTVRWVVNKEVHADELSDIVTYYFMTQRIKPGMPEYVNKLSLLHELLVTSMKVTSSSCNSESLFTYSGIPGLILCVIK